MSIERLKELHTEMGRIIAAMSGGAGDSSSAVIAPDSDLDDPRGFGDPIVKWDPKRWNGPSYAGQRMSQCPSDYLESLAGFFDWAAAKDEQSDDEKKRKYAGFKRKDAARARGHARRNKGKTFAAPKPPEDSVVDGEFDTSDLPF